MKNFWQRYLGALTPGARILLALLAAFYAAALVGNFFHWFNLYNFLPLTGAKFWSGQIWRLVTYALLPAGILDFLMNAIALGLLGGQLERHWSRGEFWLFCCVEKADEDSCRTRYR